MKLKQLFKSLEMKIVDILVNRKKRWKRGDIIRHGKDPGDYQIALGWYEIEVREKSSEIIERCILSTIFIGSAVSFLLYLIFILNLPIRALVLLGALLLIISIGFVVPIVLFIVAIENTIELLQCVFSKKYPDPGPPFVISSRDRFGIEIYTSGPLIGFCDYHTWIKVGEHTEAYYWSSKHDYIVDFEDFKCSVCGKEITREKTEMR